MDKSPERQYEDYARSIQIPTPCREAELSSIIMGRHCQDRDLAICELVTGNMRIVLSLAKKYRRMPDYVDTLFDGNLGLVKAAMDFDSAKGRFTTHAVMRVRTEIRDGLLSRTGSPISANRESVLMALKLKGLSPGEAHGLSKNDLKSAQLAMMAVSDAIPLYDDDGQPIDIIDPVSENMLEEIQESDLIELVKKATRELGLTDDEVTLVSEASFSRSWHKSIGPEIAKKRGLSTSSIRMLRTKLIWKIRRKILDYVGKDEYLVLSAGGHLPGNNWR